MRFQKIEYSRYNKSWRFLFDEKLRFEFPDISSGNWNIIFWNFRRRRQPREVYRFLAGNFRSIRVFSRNIRDFRLNGSLVENSTISGRNFARKFSYHLWPFWNFRNFQLTSKHSLILLTVTICKYLSDIWLRVRITVSADDSCLSVVCWCRILYCTQILWLPMNSAHASPRYDSHIPWSGGRVLKKKELPSQHLLKSRFNHKKKNFFWSEPCLRDWQCQRFSSGRLPRNMTHLMTSKLTVSIVWPESQCVNSH